MRKAFKFYRSYFDVAQELNDKDRLAFYDALLNRQFNGIELELNGLAKFAYISQKHSIDAQVKGYEDKVQHPITPPCVGGSVGAIEPPLVQEKEKEKEKEQLVIVPFQERVSKFLLWFNTEFIKHGKHESKFKVLNNQTEKNLKKLLDKYSAEEWNTAFENMINNSWVIETKNATPDHFLRPANFEKYLNQDKQQKNNFKFAHS